MSKRAQKVRKNAFFIGTTRQNNLHIFRTGSFYWAMDKQLRRNGHRGDAQVNKFIAVLSLSCPGLSVR